MTNDFPHRYEVVQTGLVDPVEVLQCNQPTGKGSKNSESLWRCDLCGRVVPEDSLVSIAGRRYCVKNGCAQEQQR